ncbi:MAG: radical SAM protein [Candidatus Bathyarchaeota archaeon]|nr:MAG: radical SAM protein [Candidatus Bathyarchaeota archaeon]
MSIVYGPVPSWRFGRSLGIDVITPPKKCTFDCVYCQLGRKKMHVLGPEELNQPLVDVERVLKDLEVVLKRIDLNTVDIVTFSGTGEPTLNLELDKIAKEVKRRIKDLPLAILTNASLFHRGDVRRNLNKFDFVVAKLDAGDNDTFRSINRPADDQMDIFTIVDSIKRVKKEVRGIMALEVMLLSSKDGAITNVDAKSRKRLLDAILEVNPDIIQVAVPYRPPSENSVRSPSWKKIKLISKELTNIFSEDRLWIYGMHDKRGKQVTWLKHESLEREAFNLLKRRPCRIVDVSEGLGITFSEARALLINLEKKKFVAAEKSRGEKYYSPRLSH